MLLYLTITCDESLTRSKKSGSDEGVTVRAVAKNSEVTGVAHYFNENISIFPNPVSSNNINITGAAVDYAIISDMKGNVILRGSIIDSVFELNSLEHGTYIMEIFSNDKKVKSELIIK